MNIELLFYFLTGFTLGLIVSIFAGAKLLVENKEKKAKEDITRLDLVETQIVNISRRIHETNGNQDEQAERHELLKERVRKIEEYLGGVIMTPKK